MNIKYALFVNLSANNGRAARRWERVAPEVLAMLPPDTRVVTFETGHDIEPELQSLLESGVQGFVSAGGDGSAHYLLNLLLKHQKDTRQSLWLGGVGLGSSNDFVKPKQHFISGIPIRLNQEQATRVDVGKAEFRLPSGAWESQYFIANASLGVTAEANWFFNHGDRFLHFIKNRWTGLAILYAALRTIIRFRNIPVTLSLEGQTMKTKLSNLAVLKTPYVSGSFHFDDPVQRDDGLLGINACLDMGKTALLSILIGLAQGRFRGRPQTWSIAATSLQVHNDSPVSLEMDGEVVQATDIRFSLLPKAIYLLGL